MKYGADGAMSWMAASRYQLLEELPRQRLAHWWCTQYSALHREPNAVGKKRWWTRTNTAAAAGDFNSAFCFGKRPQNASVEKLEEETSSLNKSWTLRRTMH